MKWAINRVVLFFCGMIFAFSASRLNGQAPKKVLNAFKSQYPSAKEIEWDREGNIFTVEFELHDTALTAKDSLNYRDVEVHYNAQGTALYIEEELTDDLIPVKVKEAIFKIDNSPTLKVNRITLPPKKSKYTTRIKGKNYSFSEEGVLLNKK